MFPNYRSFSPDSEAHELKKAEKALAIAVRGGVTRDFAIAMIDGGEIDFHYATPGQGAKVIMEHYAKTYGVRARWSVLGGKPRFS